MTIHDEHPFVDPEPDPVRRFRGRVGGTVTIWTSGSDRDCAGLTVTSYVVAPGEPARILALLDPDAELTERLLDTETAVVALLGWSHRDLAEMFAGQAPAPGGAFSHAEFRATAWGPLLTTAQTWAGVRLERRQQVGWSTLVTTVVEQLEVAESEEPLRHYRGRYER